ncbi:MAG: sugar transferase [Actinomycetia bacterium]|nr:sugar transferase [Actinomycetes bacterium]
MLPAPSLLTPAPHLVVQQRPSQDWVWPDDAPPVAARLLVRLFDLVVATVGLILLGPIMVLVAIVLKLTSPGPVLFRSERVGHRKASFGALKFRSMRVDADVALAELLASDPDAAAEYAHYHKLSSDPRVTKVGRFLRRSNLDELPQLFNILKGEMSVVGPRPKLMSEQHVYGSALPVVLQVKPGLTGLWQVSGRSKLSIQERVVLDVHYARHRTLVGDVLICLLTFVQMWRPTRHGAR